MDGPDAPKGHPLASVRFVILVGGFVPKDPAVVGKPGSGGWWGGNQSRDAEVSRRKTGSVVYSLFESRFAIPKVIPKSEQKDEELAQEDSRSRCALFL